MGALEIHTIQVLTDNYTYLIRDGETGISAVVDPSEAGPVLERLGEWGGKLDFVLNTHHHWDHVGGNLELKKVTGCRIVGADSDAKRLPGWDQGVNEATIFALGKSTARILSIPGHTRGHIAYWFQENAAVFTGDTLFSLGCGRLFEGTPSEMWSSLQKIMALPDETRVYCGHEYTVRNAEFALALEPGNERLKTRLTQLEKLRREGLPSVPAILGEEKALNPFLRPEDPKLRAALGITQGTAVETFAEIRRRKDEF
jgi:hydroxyacylglutathione hydrolase